MIKKIGVRELRVGMFIHDFSCHWMDHPFARSRLMLTSEDEIRKIIDAGIHEVYIDTSKGLDAAHAPTAEEARRDLEKELVAIAGREPAPVIRVSVADELARAAQIRNQAHQLVRTVMHDARLGKAIELDQVEPVVQNITESILRNPGALTGLLRIKNKDDYTFLHSVSVCTLLVAFCRSSGMDAELTRQAGLGGLLHDTGKALVPDEVLNKPGRLTDEEFEIIRRHPKDGYDILLKTPGVGEIPLDITLHHHERMDGSGYPDKLPADKISTMAQMAAIVDVYDAITADRCYHKGMPAAEALRKIFEWSKFHFNPQQVQSFMRCVGIYPVGTLVLLESGRLGVVTEPHETNLLSPKVNVFFSTKSNTYIKPVQVDLSKPLGMGGGDKIQSYQSAEKWRVDPMKFFVLPA
ncbi:HD-GYP domain-containing protein [Noviherbaspirillum sp. CPCC 100848]|uniref:HD-GYP domain-containing protein n=1 Tax=Noviherbaspirillum album TaxID=3080276 RepID=A0ABU6JGF1_9BURK|nr:HD-GYP domain-containing protein [Noviherbaspirillum sp. CPCC 100848]MEC4722493.1 HD-GYP domain-containing protein [Noviherbaspirillum sp. CPCC 100848]